MKLLATQTFDADGNTYSGGDVYESEQVAKGTLSSCLRLGWFIEPEKKKTPEPKPEPPKPKPEPPKSDWRDIPIAQLQLDDAAKRALEKAGIKTVKAALIYGAAHDGNFIEIKGIGEEYSRAIQKAIDKIRS